MTNKNIKRYLESLAFKGILGKSLKSNALAKEINDEIKGSLLKELLGDTKFTLKEEKWVPLTREITNTDDLIHKILETYGDFLTKEELTHEVAFSTNTDIENAKEDVANCLTNKRKYFSSNKKYGISDWLLAIDSPNENDVKYRNYIKEDELKEYTNAFKNADYSNENYAEVVSEIITENKIEGISLKTALYLIWLSEKSFYDNKLIFEDINKSKKLFLIDGSLYTKAQVDSYNKELLKLQEGLADLKETESITVEDLALPEVTISKIISYIMKNFTISIDYILEKYYKDLNLSDSMDILNKYLTEVIVDPRIEHENNVWYVKVAFEESDKEDIIEFIRDNETTNSEDIIEEILGVNQKHPRYNDLAKDIENILKDTTEVMYLGNNLWSTPIEMPEEASIIPDILYIDTITPTENAEGEIFDQEIEIEGFEGTLRSDIYNPLVEDVFDEDTSKTIYNINTDKQKCVLKYHHKMAGTFPLCQINPDFFGSKSELFPITLISDDITETVYVNNENRIIVGLAPFYEDINDVSGRIFYIEKTNSPNEYKFNLMNETDKSCHIDANRTLELLEIKSHLESESLTLYDIISDILHRKPLSFAQIVTEVNTVKRCSRLIIASVLSSYHCFNHNKKTGNWNLDDKKIDLGFNKTKKKYVKK